MAVTTRPAHWQIQEAKQRFSELIRSVQAEGPQFVTKHGQEIAVVIGIEEYRRLHPGGPAPDFAEFLLSGPRADGFDGYLERSGEPARDVDLGPDESA
jgi:prevent-host-death family protein